jgi:hypothetical protein
VARLLATGSQERRATLDHVLDVLIAEAKAKADVQLLRVAMIASEKAWERLRLGTVDSVTRSARAGPRGAAGRPARHTAADELASLPPGYFDATSTGGDP